MGRGSSGSKSQNSMNVPYDEWGKEVSEDVYDKDGTRIGEIEDVNVWVSEPQLDEVTKKEAVNYALEFYSKLDGGRLVDDDYKIYLAYEDGTFRDVADDPKKGLNRKGLIGVSVSTPDDEMSWGGNIGRNGQFQQWGVHDGNGDEVEGNYHSWYKTVGVYKQRVKTTYNNPNGRGGYKIKREILRRSTIKPIKG